MKNFKEFKKTPCENNCGPVSPVEGQITTKSGQIRQQEDGSLGRGHCSLLEHITWGWHPMYYIMTSVPLLQSVMPPIPWTHNNEKVDIVVVAICNMEKIIPARPTPFNVLLLKMFLFAQGKGQALVDPIKRGMK
jgi:hypothetical protein